MCRSASHSNSNSDYPFIFRKVCILFNKLFILFQRIFRAFEMLIRRKVNSDDKNNLIRTGLICNLNG